MLFVQNKHSVKRRASRLGAIHLRHLVANTDTQPRQFPDVLPYRHGFRRISETDVTTKCYDGGLFGVVREGKSFALFGCPPGIRTPICCSRGSCPTIERGGNAYERGRADSIHIVRGAVPLVKPFQRPESLRQVCLNYSSRSTSSGFCPSMRKLAIQPVPTASTAVSTIDTRPAIHCGR